MTCQSSLATFPLCLFGLLMLATLQVSDAQTGVCYGMLGSSLPPKSRVINLYKEKNIRRMRLYDPNHEALEALRNSGIEVIQDVPNINALQYVASNQQNADNWVRDNILRYPDVNFKYIAVGNEVSPLNGDTSRYVTYVVPAMKNIQRSISSNGLSGKIKVSTSVDMGLTTNPYPPSHGVFKGEVGQYVGPIIQFLKDNNSPLLVNIYPYFSLNDQPDLLDYALFKSPRNTPDGEYKSLFYAMLDVVYAALEKAGAPNMQIVVSETGWPTEGGNQANVENARTYNSNLIQAVKGGTPKRRGRAIEAYIFAMFDEDNKRGDPVEKHWGIFSANGQAKYPLSFN
ncbi:glucosidase [Lithospermum erythrorhizon]|uniref:Glucosidase n=1 Tax=Lithospermum erythrorhizon TaxID=34254 RepID=A0AAV3NT01_LITER